MTIALDPKFAKVVRLMRSTTHEGERASARARVEEVAQRCGMTFEEALRIFEDGIAPPPGGSTQAPRRTPEQAARARAWRERYAATVARLGSEEAALAPCWRERLILVAVAPWRSVNASHPRWTDRLDGWRGEGWHYAKAPARIRNAIADAYPLPATFAEAKAESDYWNARSDEMEDLIRDSAEDLGNGGLDLAADLRSYMVRDLMEKDLRLTTLADLQGRFAMYRAMDWHNDEVELALFRDLTAVVERQARAAIEASAQRSAPAAPIRPVLDGSIRDALAADPSRSDRAIARALGCSPTTVGQIRGRMGLSGAARSVRHGGQMYGMGGHTAPSGGGRMRTSDLTASVRFRGGLLASLLAYAEREAARRAKASHPGMMRLQDGELAALLDVPRQKVRAGETREAAGR